MTANQAEIDADAAKRLTLTVDGCSVGFVEFYLFGNVAIVTHTEVEFLHRGKGLGAMIARQALQHFHSENWKVVPVCAFFLEQLRQLPEFTDLLTPHCRRIFAV